MYRIKNYFAGIYHTIHLKILVARVIGKSRKRMKLIKKMRRKYAEAGMLKDSPYGLLNTESDTIDTETAERINAEADAEIEALSDTMTDMSDTAELLGVTEDEKEDTGELLLDESMLPWGGAASWIKKELNLTEDIESCGDKRFMIMHLKESVTAEECRELHSHRAGQKYVDYVKLPVGGRDIFENGNVEFTFNEIPCSLAKTEKTVIDTEDAEGDVYCLFEFYSRYHRLKDDPISYPCECLGIMPEKTYLRFEKDGNKDSVIKNMKEYFRLSGAQREYVRKMADRPAESGNKKNGSIYVPINDSESLTMLYETCKESYPDYIRSRVELLFDRLKIENYGSKRTILTQLSYSLGINTVPAEHPVRSYDEVIAILDKHIYGMNDLKTALAEYYVTMQRSGEKGCLMLLVGPPGVGKTSVCEALAELWDVPLAHVDCTGVDAITMGGLVTSYSDARPGKVMNALYSAGTADVVLRLDELDKMQKSSTNGGDPYSVFTKPFGPQRVFYDEFVGDIDLRCTKIIATANDCSQIPGYILNRFEDNVFYISAYSADEKFEIGKNYLVPKLFKSFGISDGEIRFTDGAMRLIARGYCDDEGARCMEGYLKQLIRKVIADRSRGRVEIPFTIDEEYVKERLMKKTDTHVRKIGIAV